MGKMGDTWRGWRQAQGQVKQISAWQGPMIECSLGQGCEGEWQDTGVTNHPCCLCLASSPLPTGILCLWPFYEGWVTGLLVLFHSVPRRGESRLARHVSLYSTWVGWRYLPVWSCAPSVVGEIFVSCTSPCLLKNDLASMAVSSYNLKPAKPEEDWFLCSCLSREFFQATVPLHLHCLLCGVLGWVSV